MFYNKREIFSFRKYKAYGLASAVIAAFFLAGGVAHADEVTPATTAEVTQVAPEVVTDAPTNESTQPTSVTTPAAKPVEEFGVVPETTGRTPEIAEGTPNTNRGESFDRAASETNTQIHGNFVVMGTDKSEKHLTKADRVDGAYMLEGTYTFTSSGTDTVNGAQLVYESEKKFLGKPTFSESSFVTKITDQSDDQTWRYSFDLTSIGGAAKGQISVKQKSNGMIWSGPTSSETLSGTFKFAIGGNVLDTDTVSVTTDRIKGGLYRSDATIIPTNIRELVSLLPSEAIVGVHDGNTFLDESRDYRITLPTPHDTAYLMNKDNESTNRDYERYTDFKYQISGIPDYLELDPTEPQNSVWTRDGDRLVMHLTPSQPFNQEYYKNFRPQLRLKASALSDTDKQELMVNEKRVKLTWRTDGILSDGTVYTQELPDPTGILLKTRNDKEPLPEGKVVYTYSRTQYANPLRGVSDHSNETFNVSSTMQLVSRSGKQISNPYYYIHIPKDQTGDHFTYFKPAANYFNANIGVNSVNAMNQGLTMKEPLELYGVEVDGSVTKLASWSRIDSAVEGVQITGKYQKLLVKSPTLRDVSSRSAERADVYSWGADVAYAVDNTRWNRAVEDDSVRTMVNGLRTDFVRAGGTLEDGARTEQKSLTAQQLKETGRIYVHDKADFVHTLSHSINVGSPTGGDNKTDAKLQLGDKAYVGFYGELAPYYQYLRAGGGVQTDRFDTIEKTYTSVLVPDGVNITNARVNLTNNMTSPDTAQYGYLEYTNRQRPIKEPVAKLINYQGSGKTLYVYETTPDADIVKAINKLNISQYEGAERPSVEMTFEFRNNGALPAGSYEIQYATIWDKRSEMISPAEDQTLASAGQTLDNVLPTNLQDGFTDKKVSVKKVPFTVSYQQEYASRLYIGEDEHSATESEMNGVHLGKVLTVQSRSMNFSDLTGTLTDVIVSIPNGSYKAVLAEKIQNGSNYKVLYTTDENTKSGTYGEAPSDLGKVTAVRYVFNSPLTLNPGENFVTNMKVRVPEDAPASSKAEAQLFTSSNGTNFLDANKVSITTTRNMGDVTVYYVDVNGHELQPSKKQEGLSGTSYVTTKPDVIERDGFNYRFKEVKSGSDAESGQYMVDQHKRVTYVYEKDTQGSVRVRHVDGKGVDLVPEAIVKNRVPDGEAYTTTPLADRTTTTTTTLPNGSTQTVLTTYTLRETPNNANGVVIGGKDIRVTYVYDVTKSIVTTGSVIASHKDIEGWELVPNSVVVLDAPDGSAYVSHAATIPPEVETFKTPEGLTKTITTSYQLVSNPSNATGTVRGGETIEVPYVYDKVVTTRTNGSVFATYKDEDGVEVGSPEKVITNQPGGTYYAAAAKDIQGSAQSFTTPEGRTATITTYSLISTPSNETGEVRDGEIIEVPYVYRKNIVTRFVPGNTPIHELPEASVTQFVNERGEEIKASESGLVTAPPMIGTYEFTGRTETNEGGDVQTHIYKEVVSEIPNEAPQVDVPALEVTRYVNEAGEVIKGEETGLVTAVPMIGDTYEFTGRTETTDDGHIQTHIYKQVEFEVPGDAPQVEVPALDVTRYVNESGDIIKDEVTGLVPAPSMIGDAYEFTGRTETTEDGHIQTHIYKKVVSEIPGDAPIRYPAELQITRFVTEDGTKEVAPMESGIVGERSVIGEYQYTGRSTHEDGIHTHYYKLIDSSVPNDAPQVDVPALDVTRYVNEKDEGIKDAIPELLPAPNMIGDMYEFTGRTTTTEDGHIQTHVYKEVEHVVPNDAPHADKPTLLVTRYIDEDGFDIHPSTDGFVSARKYIGEYEFSGLTKLNDGKDVQSHIYRKSTHEVPHDAPQLDKPELLITRHIDEYGHDLTSVEKGRHKPRTTIGTYEYTHRTTETGGITTHYYAPIRHEVPGDAPQVDKPALMVTRFVNESHEIIKGEVTGLVPAPGMIGETYQFTGRTETTEDGNVQTHIYQEVRSEVPGDAPIVDKPEAKVTRYVNDEDIDLKDPEKGRHNPPSSIGDYEFSGKTTEKDGITTHFYKRVPKTEEPKREVPKTEEPKREVPKTEEPKREVPKTEEPKREVPKTEEPKRVVSRADELPNTGDSDNATAIALGALSLGLFGLARRKREE